MTPVPKLYWEDFNKGNVAEYGPRLVTREEIVAFAAEFDPQPFHLDEDAARASMFGGLAASGWHSCSLLMRIIADGFVVNSSSMGSPGVEEVKWLAPVRPGDRLTVRATVLETRASRTRPEMGLVNFLFEMFNQAGVRVMILTTTSMFGRRLAETSLVAPQTGGTA
jgi:acyl dehydratase